MTAPDEWKVRRLGELVKLTSGQSPSRFIFGPTGTPYFKVDQLGKSTKYLDRHQTPYTADELPEVPSGSVLIAKRGGAIALNRVRLLTEPGFMDTNVMALTTGTELDSEFLYYWLSYRGLWDIADVTSVPQINNKHINPLELRLPSLDEQRVIVGALKGADDLIASLERLLAKKRDVKRGMTQELLSGRSRITGSTETWPEVSLLDLVTIRRGQVDPRRPEFRDLPLIAPDHIEPGTGRLLAVKTAADQSAISGKYLVEPGDVIYSKIRPYLRKVHLAKFRALCSADMYPLQPKRSVDSRFILNALLSERFTDFAVSASMRSGIPKINRVELAAYQLDAPPGEEQAAIGQALQDADALIDSLERRLAVARALKQGMVQELLTGRTCLSLEAAS
ncbi:restriction endonuclease subunit S [Streptomyces sp. HO565]|uniref:restriction endonuclease subunit S n=1 Tax=Streptomyces sp. HO565 TaxID=2857489 RepID=UPI0034DBC66D